MEPDISIVVSRLTNACEYFRFPWKRRITTKLGGPYKDRIIHFARLNYEGINEKGWSERTAAELELSFKAGAQGLKVWKDVGLTLKNPDGAFVQADDPRFDATWEMPQQAADDSPQRFLRPFPAHQSRERAL